MVKGASVRDLVLVVDDSPETLGLVNDSLERAGMTTLVALEGQQALNIAHKMTPDIILLDAMMPHMDGFTTCRELKRDPELRAIPVIFMTGLSETEDIVRGFEAGGVDYITKPVNPTELVARIKVHLANARVTLSAQTALDSAGQNICAVDRRGQLLWATPQARQLIEAAGAAGWSQAVMATPVETWLTRLPNEGDQLRIAAPALPLRLVFIGQSSSQELLLRIVNEQQPDEITLLRQAFPVTDREAEVLLWVAKGKTNREIAQILELSPRTINKHLEQVFRKVGVENRTSAAAMAVGALQKQRGYR